MSISRAMTRLSLQPFRPLLCWLVLACWDWQTAEARTIGQSKAAAFVVGNDRGGFIRARLNEIARLRTQARPVEIRGKVCFSTCTMFLGLPDVCVSRDTTFGFHGPAMAIGRLSPAQFEQLSRLIASHYPAVLADWYLRIGRTRTAGLYRVSGANLIRLGVPECRPAPLSRKP